MGNDRALLFMEGVRPIRARKIRYYQVPWLARRVLPPPVVPAIEPILAMPVRTVETATAESEPAAQASPSASDTSVGGGRTFHPGTVEDVERIEELTLEDFELDLSSVVFPEVAPGERIPESALARSANDLVALLKGAPVMRGED